MDTNFTQGAWVVGNLNAAKQGLLIRSEQHLESLALVFDNGYPMEANANLIAAAPELYQALLDLTLMAQAWQTDFAAINRDSPDYDPSYKVEYNKETLAALDALAKARGEQ